MLNRSTADSVIYPASNFTVLALNNSPEQRRYYTYLHLRGTNNETKGTGPRTFAQSLATIFLEDRCNERGKRRLRRDTAPRREDIQSSLWRFVRVHRERGLKATQRAERERKTERE